MSSFKTRGVVSLPTLLYIARRASRGARNSIDFKELAKARPGEARTLEPMLFFGVTILICQNGFVGSHAAKEMRTNGLMTPLQFSIRGTCPDYT